MDYINSYIDEWKRLRTDEEMFINIILKKYNFYE